MNDNYKGDYNMSDDLAERVAVIEEKQRVYDKNQDEIIKRLDVLLGLRHKGIGAFFVVSSIAGTGIIGLAATIIEFVRSHV